MNEWAGFFLGVMAVTALVQCAFVIVAALGLRRTGEKVNQLCDRAISDSGREQAARVEALLATTLESVETTIENVKTLVIKPIASLTELSAFWSGLRRGVESYRETEPKKRPTAVPKHRSEDSDEHMFIG